MKRWRIPHAKPGQLLVRWGKDESTATPSLVYAWGDGAHKGAAGMLSYAFESRELYPGLAGEHPSSGKTLIQLLDSAGYDITTLRFTVIRKPQTQHAGTPG